MAKRGDTQIILGKRSRIEFHANKIRDFLYDEGPHTVYDIAEHINVTPEWASDILCYMKASGEVSNFRRDLSTYWILYEDAQAA